MEALAAATQASHLRKIQMGAKMKKPEFFPLFGWSHNKWLARPRPIEEDLKEMAECGLNIACFARVEELDLCQKHGLKAIINDQRLRYDWAQGVD